LEKLGIGTVGNSKLRFKDKRLEKASTNTIDETNTAKFNSFDYTTQEKEKDNYY
jgi:hypothetical protein